MKNYEWRTMNEELEQAAKMYTLIIEYLTEYSFKILAAIIILIIGIFVARKISKLLLNLLVSRDIDITLSRFLSSGARVMMVVMVAIVALDKINIPVTPFVAAVGALSLGAGLALQGLLSNYGAGVNIIITRPFVIGDTISVQGVSGIVEEVHLAYTVLFNEDEVQITIPNKHIVGEILKNSHADSIVEISVGIAYSSNPEAAIAIILAALKAVDGISESRDPQVGIDNFGDSSIDIGMRFWVKTEVLYQTKYIANAAVFKALMDNNIEIPFPQRHVQLVQAEA